MASTAELERPTFLKSDEHSALSPATNRRTALGAVKCGMRYRQIGTFPDLMHFGPGRSMRKRVARWTHPWDCKEITGGGLKKSPNR
jgi:hypothetical protein